MLELDERDPKFESASCLDARNIAIKYDDKVLARMGTGLALGLFLGPFGIPLAVAADVNQNKEREYLNKEIDRRCKTQPYEAVTKPTENSGGSVEKKP
jgi:hypothetical protein